MSPTHTFRPHFSSEMNPSFPLYTPARPATTPVSSSQFNPAQVQVQVQVQVQQEEGAVPVCTGSRTTNYPSNNQPVVVPAAALTPTSRPPPRIRSVSNLVPAVRPGPAGWQRGSGSGSGAGAGAGPHRVSPYNTINAALAAKHAAEARRAREFDPDYMFNPIPTRPLPTVPPAPVYDNSPNGPNNNPAATPAARDAVTPAAVKPQPPPSQSPIHPVVPRRPLTEAEAKKIENKAHLERSLAAIAKIEQSVKAYCDIHSATGFQFGPSPRH